MANYMEEVANMIGVEMDQDFECNEICYTLRIAKNGLKCGGRYSADILMMILDGELTIKHNPWKPKYGDMYYCVNSQGVVVNEQWYDDFIDKVHYKLGNCYKQESQAEANRDKWISFYESDEVLEV